jgi:hypothetical protein
VQQQNENQSAQPAAEKKSFDAQENWTERRAGASNRKPTAATELELELWLAAHRTKNQQQPGWCWAGTNPGVGMKAEWEPKVSHGTRLSSTLSL